MFTTSNMGLTAWDLGTDPYDHSDLANNFVAIDGHDHTTGKGKQIPAAGIVDGAITTAKIAANAVTSDKIPDGAIGQSELANDSVGAAQVIDGSIGAAEIANGSITLAKLDPSILPVGSVIMWYRPNSGVALPTGWEIMDGRPWSSVSNAWGVSSGNMPDMRNRFPLGAATTGTGSGTGTPPDIGQSGGSMTATLDHSHTVDAHSHTIGDHTHGISSDGSHKHGFVTTIWDGGGNPVGTTVTDGMQRGTAVPGSQGTRQSFYIPDLNRSEYYGENVSAPMQTTGSHAHGGATTGTVGGAFASGTTAPNTSTWSNTLDKRPQYVGLLFIMRVN